MRVGQPVEVSVDAYPDLKFKGHVQNIQSGAGARFSLFSRRRASKYDNIGSNPLSQNRARAIAQVAVSPDGKRIAFLEAGQIRLASFNNLVQSLHIIPAAPGQSCPASNLIWSPDSASLASLSDCDTPPH